MWIDEVAPERLAEIFYHYHQALLPAAVTGRREAKDCWKDVSAQERSRLVAAARLTLLELNSAASDREKPRPFFAQPGEAEWGC